MIFWGNEPDGEIDGYGFEPKYVSSGLYKRFLSVRGEEKMRHKLGRFIIERGNEINDLELVILQKCFSELKDMRDKY